MSKLEAKILNPEAIKGLVQGLNELEKDKSIKAGLKKGVQVLVRGGRKRLGTSLLNKNKGTGNLMRSIAPRVKRRKLGALAGFRRPMGNHSHLLDRGTKDRYTKKGAYRGRMKATLFWAQTHDSDMSKAVTEVVTGIEKAVNRIKQRQ